MDKIKIIIILSRNSLSMRYLDSSVIDGNPVSFGMDGESIVPLSICCEDTNFIIGNYAYTEASKGNVNAFKNFFNAITEIGSFNYHGQREDIKTLLFRALTYNIDLFLETEFHKDLETMIQDIQIIFVFQSDIKVSEKNIILSQFMNLKFDDVKDFSFEKLFIQYLDSVKVNNLFLKIYGGDLLAVICDENGDVKVLERIGEFGMNPKIEFAINLLWDSLGPYSYYFDKDKEKTVLEDFVIKFLNSGVNEINDCITLSDGNHYQCFLSLHEINNYQPSGQDAVLSEIERFLNRNGIEEEDCNLVLQCGVSNTYLGGILERLNFNTIVMEGETELNEVFKLALKNYGSSEEQVNVSVNKVPPPPPPPIKKSNFVGAPPPPPSQPFKKLENRCAPPPPPPSQPKSKTVVNNVPPPPPPSNIKI